MSAEINATRRWLETVVVGLNFCPFAKRELIQDTIRYVAEPADDFSTALVALEREYVHLQQDDEIETTLLVLTLGFSDFYSYLELVERANRALGKLGWEGVFQLASFHPEYCFADASPDDPANYTNRSPYPMLHILREQSLEKAIERYPQPENIPNNNIAKAQSLGLDALVSLLEKCHHKPQSS